MLSAFVLTAKLKLGSDKGTLYFEKMVLFGLQSSHLGD